MNIKINNNMREDFENWLFAMDDELDKFLTELPTEVSKKLNYTPESLDILEEWMLKNFSDHKELLSKNNKKVQDNISRYIGETFRKNLDSKWSIRFDDQKFAFFGLPILIENGNTIVCPHTLSTTTLARREANFLSTILFNNITRLGEKRT